MSINADAIAAMLGEEDTSQPSANEKVKAIFQIMNLEKTTIAVEYVQPGITITGSATLIETSVHIFDNVFSPKFEGIYDYNVKCEDPEVSDFLSRTNTHLIEVPRCIWPNDLQVLVRELNEEIMDWDKNAIKELNAVIDEELFEKTFG